MAKNTKKFTLRLLVALTLASATFSHDCSDNCYNCFSLDYCTECYRRKVVTGRILKCSTQPLPSSDNCLIYGQYRGCDQCKPGWALLYSNGPTNPCVKGTIQNCLNEQIIAGEASCYSCLGGYPNSDASRCIPTDQVKDPIPRCTVGVFNSDTRKIQCYQCAPGYTVSFNLNHCFKTPPSLKGCLRAGLNGNCSVCDGANGYFDRDEHGGCSKNSSAFV